MTKTRRCSLCKRRRRVAVVLWGTDPLCAECERRILRQARPVKITPANSEGTAR